MIENPGISVIIPYYKARKTIDRCLDSIFSQSKKPLEIILVVDKKDSEAMSELGEKYGERVRVLEGGNGVSANRNIGLDNCRGG